MASFAASRVIAASVPVRTKVFPVSGPVPRCGGCAFGVGGLDPDAGLAQARDESRIVTAASNHVRTDCATTGPISCTACRASTIGRGKSRHAAEGARQQLRRTLADVPDAQPMNERATTRSGGCDRSRRPGCARPSPASAGAPVPTSRSRGATTSSASVVRRRDGRGRRRRAPGPARRADRRSLRRAPRCSSRSATRSARCAAGAAPGTRLFSQRHTTSSSGRTSRLPHDGHSSGIAQGSDRSARSGSTTFTTFGMTSPPFSIRTRSPTRMSFRATSSALWRVALAMVDPASRTGSSTATGVTAPVRPTCRAMRLQRGRRPAGAGNLNAIAQRGNFDVAPSRSRARQRVQP